MGHQILKIAQLTKEIGLSSSSIYRLIQEGKFPAQIKLSERSSGWLKSEIDQWLEERIAASRKEVA